jgi:CRP-like cAMP-binding protein
MSDLRTQRLSRELFAAAVGANIRGLQTWVVDRLAALLEEEQVAAGDVVFAAGEAADTLSFVRRGRVELVRPHGTTEQVEGPRAIGTLDVLADRARTSTAIACTPLQLWKVASGGWFELLEDSFELTRMSVLALAAAVARLEEAAWQRGELEESRPSLELSGSKPLDAVERVVLLMRIPPLEGIGVQPLNDLASASREVSFAPGEPLFVRGRPHPVLALVEGSVEARREGPAVTWTGGAGSIVCGTVAFLRDRDDWEARAIQPTRALAFEIDDWLDVMEETSRWRARRWPGSPCVTSD